MAYVRKYSIRECPKCEDFTLFEFEECTACPIREKVDREYAANPWLLQEKAEVDD